MKWWLPVLATIAFLAGAPAASAVQIEHQDATQVTGDIAGIPPRIEASLAPGTSRTFRIGFQNRRGRPIAFEVVRRDVGGPERRPEQMFVLSQRAPYGASSWLKVDTRGFVLQHGDIAWVNVTARAPRDAQPGSYYSAVAAYAGAEMLPGGTGDASAAVQGGVGVQLFFTVPGKRVLKGELDVDHPPRLVWRDRETRIALDIRYANTGNVTDVVGGTISLTSPFGKRVGRSRVGKQYVLRGGVREYRFLWSDPPWIGRFTPRVEMVGQSGKREVLELDPVWIIPSWRYLLAVLVAVAAPLAWNLRRRRRGSHDAEDDDGDEDSTGSFPY